MLFIRAWLPGYLVKQVQYRRLLQSPINPFEKIQLLSPIPIVPLYPDYKKDKLKPSLPNMNYSPRPIYPNNIYRKFHIFRQESLSWGPFIHEFLTLSLLNSLSFGLSNSCLLRAIVQNNNYIQRIMGLHCCMWYWLYKEKKRSNKQGNQPTQSLQWWI
jgi:hypothetical protein